MAVKYVPFYPDPIEGQAILNNFVRTLKYKGNNLVKDGLKRGMPSMNLKKLKQSVKTNPETWLSGVSVFLPVHI